MSVSWLNAAWCIQTGSPTRKAVLMVLADHANEDGSCWPAVTTIATKTELGTSTVRRILGELEDDGFITIEPQTEADRGGRQTSNKYWLTISPPISPRGGRVQEREGAPLGARGSTRTTNEPSEGRKRTPGRSASPAARPKSRRDVLPEDHGDDESPALGASPRKDTAARKEVAAQRGTSGVGLALRLQQALEKRRDIPHALTIVDVTLLSRKLVQYQRGGASWDTLAKAVELYGKNPTRYTKGEDVKGWVGFLAAWPKLEADAGKHARADAGGSRYGGAYEGITE